MGIEKGSVVIYKKQFWLFGRHSSDERMNPTYVLHGLNGEIIEVPEEDCNVLIEPSEMEV